MLSVVGDKIFTPSPHIGKPCHKIYSIPYWSPFTIERSYPCVPILSAVAAMQHSASVERQTQCSQLRSDMEQC